MISHDSSLKKVRNDDMPEQQNEDRSYIYGQPAALPDTALK
jgi:hypothetical protein